MGLVSVVVAVSSKIPQIAAGARQRTADAMRKAAYDIEAEAKRRAPVVTGFLRNSIQAEPDAKSDLAWRVTAYADYSIYQELGTVYQPGTPFLIPAAEAVRPQLEQALRQIVGGRASVDFDAEDL